MSESKTSRRDAMKAGGVAVLAATLPHPLFAQRTSSAATELQRLSIGIVADVHQDVIHDAYARIRVFIDEMKERQPDLLIQLGDFAVPHTWNQPFLDVWNEFGGPKYHVLGNHDMDHGFSKLKTMQWWGMVDRHYAFDAGGWHFVVLDGNDKNPEPWSGYVRYVAEAQRNWLAQDLASTDAPTLVFSHQSLEAPGGIANGDEVRGILEHANRQAGWKKVFACFSGHHHADYLREINGIPYIQINSMSYKWVGSEHQRSRFARHIEHAYPWVSHTVPYREPLYTVLTLDPQARKMTIEGMETEFIPPTPKEMGITDAERMVPTITARELTLLAAI